MYYIALDTPQECLDRIANRVRRGGHNISEVDVERRFAGRWDAVARILPYCDTAEFYDNDNGFVEVAEYRNGELLTDERYRDILNQYRGYANCVLFMGGEWHPDELVHKLATAKELGFDTCLYTGEETVSDEILSNLTWLKTGPWVESLGGLTSPTTNQRFIEVKTNKLINHQFLKTL